MNFSFTFDPKKKGLRQVLGDLEASIMEVVWEEDQTTVRDVFEKISAKRDIAYTTVMTVMSRLAEKGLLHKVKDGSAYNYTPALSRSDFNNSTVSKVMENLFESFSKPSMSQFVDSFDDDPAKLDELAALIEKKRKNQK